MMKRLIAWAPLLIFCVFFFGCVSDQEKAREELKEKGYNYNELSFLKALKTGDVETSRLFLRAGMDRLGENPILMDAIQQNSRQFVATLIEADVDVNARGVRGLTPLMMAAGNNRPVILKLLLLKGAELEARDDVGNTALLWAATFNDPLCAQILIESKADIFAKNNKGQTVLDMATDKGVRKVLDDAMSHAKNKR